MLLATLLARLPSLWEPRFAHDEGLMAAVATEMLKGQRLYVQVWGNLQPLAYDFMAGVLGLTGAWHPGMQMVLALQVLVSTALVFLIARRLGGHPAPTGLMFGLICALPVVEGDLQGTELMGMPFLLGGVLCGIGGGPVRAVAGGALLLLAGLFQPTYLLDALCLPWYVTLSGRPLRVLPLLGGAAGAALAAFLALQLTGTWAAYTSILGSERAELWWANGGAELAPIALLLRLAPLGAGLFAGLRIGLEQRSPAARLLGAWLPLAVVGAVLSPRGFMHQSLEMLPPLVVMLGLWMRPALVAPVAVGAVLILQAAMFLPRMEMFLLARWPLPEASYGTAFGWPQLPGYYKDWYDRLVGVETWRQYSDTFPGRPADVEDLAAAMKVEGRLEVWGDLPWLYVVSGRRQAGRYIARDAAYGLEPGADAASITLIRQERPEYLVLVDRAPPALDRELRSQFDRLRPMPGPWPVYGLHSG